MFELETAVGITKFKSRTVQREARLSLGGWRWTKADMQAAPFKGNACKRLARARPGLFCMFQEDKGCVQNLWTLKGLFFPVCMAEIK